MLRYKTTHRDTLVDVLDVQWSGCAVEGLVRATLGLLWWMCYGRASGGRTEAPEPHSPTGAENYFTSNFQRAVEEVL